MTTLHKALVGVALLLGLVIGLLIPQGTSLLGGTTNLDSLGLDGTLSVAQTSTLVGIQNTGVFNTSSTLIVQGASTFRSSSTATVVQLTNGNSGGLAFKASSTCVLFVYSTTTGALSSSSITCF